MTEAFNKAIVKLRVAYFGENATAKTHRDSYIISIVILRFNADNKGDLLSNELAELDNQVKTSKTISLQLSADEVVSGLQTILGLSESELIRRIVYYTAMHIEELKTPSERAFDDLDAIRLKISVLEKQLHNAIQTLKEFKNLVGGEENDKTR